MPLFASMKDLKVALVLLVFLLRPKNTMLY
jgi:hypothetical protein